MPTSRPNELTAREKEIVIMIASGLSSRQIALKLGLSLKTVLAHRYKAMEKLEVKNVAQLTRFAIRTGLVEPEPPPLTLDSSRL